MSEKKTLSRSKTPGTNKKKSSYTPQFKQPLNKNLLRSLTNLASDSSINNETVFGQEVVATNWNLQCALTTNEYIQSIMQKHIVQKAVKNYERKLDDQLAIEGKILRRFIAAKNNLTNEINDLEMKITIKQLTSKLNHMYSDLQTVISDHNLMEKFEVYIKFVESVTSRLYLHNINQFHTQAQYDEFSSLAEKCLVSIDHLKQTIDDEMISLVLSEKLEKFLELKCELRLQQKMLSDALSHINFVLFRNISDGFALNDTDE